MEDSTTKKVQRVVVIQDASKRVNKDIMRSILNGFSLKTGDTLVLVLALHQVTNPMGYKIKVDNSIFGANQKIVDDEIERKKTEYKDDQEFVEIMNLYKMKKIEMKIELHAVPSPKIAALEVAQKWQATWLILDRQMKKDIKYFVEKLSCGISRIKRDNSLEKIRRPKALKTRGSVEDQEINNHFSFQISSSSLGSKESASLSKTNSEKARILIKETYMLLNEETKSIKEKFPFDTDGNNDAVNIQICTVCKNARPIVGQRGRIFSYANVVHATNRFSRQNLISEGAHGPVFGGKLNSRQNIAVKLLRDLSSNGERKFKSEIEILEKTRHKNLVILLGSFSEKSHRLLVYEYVCNGSLDKHLSVQNRGTLTWKERMKIAEGLCKGLCHLHEKNIIHRNITPKRVLLTHDFDAVLGGFGQARRLERSEEMSPDESIVGGFGYLAPEYAETGKTTKKTDVYSFGMVLLELISGRSIADKRLNGKSLLGWARPLLKEMKYSELIDPRIGESHVDHEFASMVQLTDKCLCKDPEKRICMNKVVSTIEQIIEQKCSYKEETDEDATKDPCTVLLGTPVSKQAKDFFQEDIAQ